MRYIIGLTMLFSLFTFTAFAQDNDIEEKFPKSGYIKTGSAEVKAGDNANFETLCTLEKSDAVKIVGKRYSWYKVILPKKASLYISRDYVALTSDEKGIGIVTGTSVNLRSGPGTRYPILGEISKPAKVYILSENNGWYKIEPPYGTAGWINSNQIAVTEDDQIKKSEQEESESKQKETAVKKTSPDLTAISKTKKEDAIDSTIRLNANFPPAKEKGNLTIR
ncbi:MAG: SH3 domain-containing protein [Candidatus Omnitrophota bacterium]|nr:SH3 domain-containing protein [Candidatus Omnitrophota bacterium]